MKLLPRRAQPAEPAAAESAEPVSADGRKGRPTPKRRDVTVPRGPVTAPKTRKEAYQRQRQQTRAQRRAPRATASGSSGSSTAGMSAQDRRAALRAGDPSVLPRRDQGATRKLARDYVDSHRLLSNYMLWLFPLLLVGYVIPYVQFGVIFVFLALVVEWFLTGRRIRAMATERFGKADGSPMSIGFYAGSRAYLPRRWRLPAPQVERGESI